MTTATGAPFRVGDFVRVRENGGSLTAFTPGDLLRVVGVDELWGCVNLAAPDGTELYDGAGWSWSRFEPASLAGVRVRVAKPAYSFDKVGDLGRLTGARWGDSLGVEFGDGHPWLDLDEGWVYGADELEWLDGEVEFLDEPEAVYILDEGGLADLPDGVRLEDRDGDLYAVHGDTILDHWNDVHWPARELVYYAPIRVLNPEALGDFKDPSNRGVGEEPLGMWPAPSFESERLSSEALDALRAKLLAPLEDSGPAFRVGDGVRVLRDGDPGSHALFLNRPLVPGETARVRSTDSSSSLRVRFDADGLERWVTPRQIELAPEPARPDWDTLDLPALVDVETLRDLPNGTVARYVYTSGELCEHSIYKIGDKWVYANSGWETQLVQYGTALFLVVFLPD
jgi:hypothetical protein